MPDQIFSAGPLPAPLKYNVPGSQRMIPRACQALFNGSGASGDFVPALIFRSQAGHVIARAILDSTITAGDDAEVSWFPGVKHTAAGASFTPQSCAAFSATPIGNVVAGFAAIAWTAIQTEPSSIFSIDAGDPTKILVNGYGYYLMSIAFQSVSNPLTLTTPLLLQNEVEDANGLGTLTYLTNAIDVKDATVADPKEVRTLEGFDYWSGATGYTLPFNARVFMTNGQTINVQRVSMFLTRLSPTPIV